MFLKNSIRAIVACAIALCLIVGCSSGGGNPISPETDSGSLETGEALPGWDPDDISINMPGRSTGSSRTRVPAMVHPTYSLPEFHKVLYGHITDPLRKIDPLSLTCIIDGSIDISSGLTVNTEELDYGGYVYHWRCEVPLDFGDFRNHMVQLDANGYDGIPYFFSGLVYISNIIPPEFSRTIYPLRAPSLSPGERSEDPLKVAIIFEGIIWPEWESYYLNPSNWTITSGTKVLIPTRIELGLQFEKDAKVILHLLEPLESGAEIRFGPVDIEGRNEERSITVPVGRSRSGQAEGVERVGQSSCLLDECTCEAEAGSDADHQSEQTELSALHYYIRGMSTCCVVEQEIQWAWWDVINYPYKPMPIEYPNEPIDPFWYYNECSEDIWDYSDVENDQDCAIHLSDIEDTIKYGRTGNGFRKEFIACEFSQYDYYRYNELHDYTPCAQIGSFSFQFEEDIGNPDFHEALELLTGPETAARLEAKIQDADSNGWGHYFEGSYQTYISALNNDDCGVYLWIDIADDGAYPSAILGWSIDYIYNDEVIFGEDMMAGMGGRVWIDHEDQGAFPGSADCSNNEEIVVWPPPPSEGCLLADGLYRYEELVQAHRINYLFEMGVDDAKVRIIDYRKNWKRSDNFMPSNQYGYQTRHVGILATTYPDQNQNCQQHPTTAEFCNADRDALFGEDKDLQACNLTSRYWLRGIILILICRSRF